MRSHVAFDNTASPAGFRYLVKCISFVFISIFSIGSIQGCSVLPGMFVVPNKSPQSDESLGTDTDYDLIKVTPRVVRELANENKLHVEVFTNDIVKSKSYPYRLGPQDVLRIFVWGNPDLTPVTTTVSTTNVASTPAGRTIDDNGNIFFPLAGIVPAAGQTVSQFRETLTKRLSRSIKDPQVEVEVAGFRSQKVFISGEVRNPGIVPITDQPLYLTDAIGQAGGATNNSDLYGVVLTRGKFSRPINLDLLYFNGDLTNNVLLENGDVVSIPDRSQRKVFVLGEVGNAQSVNQARSYVMRRGNMTLTEVLSDAGGVSPFSGASNEVYVMRMGKNERPVVYVLDALHPQALVLAEQFPIQPRDVVFVNPTGPTMIGRFIGQFLPLVQSVSTASATPF